MNQRIKLKSRQWVGPGSPRPKKFKKQPSAAKVMARAFREAKGVIMLDFSNDWSEKRRSEKPYRTLVK